MCASPECKTGKKKSSGVTLIFEPQCDACIVALWFFRGVFVMSTKRVAGITFEIADRNVEYDPATGLVRRKTFPNSTTIRGWHRGWIRCKTETQYLTVCIEGVKLPVHRLAFLLVIGSLPQEHVDHISGDTLDNRFENLRCVSRQENLRNCKLQHRNKTGVTGVKKHFRKFVASITVDKKQIHLGCFSTIEDAAESRKSAEIHYGFHPNHGRKS